MNRALTFSLAVMLALPLLAEEPKGEQKKDASTTATVQPADTDSPLVKASKRSGRRARGKSIVITNQTVKTSKGHVTTSHTPQAPLVVPEPKLGPEAQLAADKAQREAAAREQRQQQKEEARKAAERRAEERAIAAKQAEDGMLDEDGDVDPAAAERAAAKAAEEEQSARKPPVA